MILMILMISSFGLAFLNISLKTIIYIKIKKNLKIDKNLN